MLPAERSVNVRGFRQSEFAQAKRLLAESEHQYLGTKNQAALVATNSLNDLKKAYPNYFADTAHFTNILIAFEEQAMMAGESEHLPGSRRGQSASSGH